MRERGASMFVRLTKKEWGYCELMAQKRHSESTSNGAHCNIAGTGLIDPIRAHVIGYVGELAVSICFGIPVNIESYARYDVGQFQVRAIEDHYKSLAFKLNGKDKPEDVFIGALLLPDRLVKLYGWAYGKEIVEKGIKRTGTGSFEFYGLQQEKTNPIIDLFCEGSWWPPERARFDYEIQEGQTV